MPAESSKRDTKRRGVQANNLSGQVRFEELKSEVPTAATNHDLRMSPADASDRNGTTDGDPGPLGPPTTGDDSGWDNAFGDEAQDGNPTNDNTMDGDDDASMAGFLGSIEPSVEDEVTSMLLQQLGSSGRSYKREARQGFKQIVNEIYSPPRITAELRRWGGADTYCPAWH